MTDSPCPTGARLRGKPDAEVLRRLRWSRELNPCASPAPNLVGCVCYDWLPDACPVDHRRVDELSRRPLGRRGIRVGDGARFKKNLDRNLTLHHI